MKIRSDRRFGVERVSRQHLDLAYVRAGRRGATPLLMIPGGPGLGSVLPYRRLRRMAAQRGFDVIMVEHRGVGFSRRDRTGKDLQREHLTITEAVEDLVAVIDACAIDRVVVYGTSYGGYLAQVLGATHPERVSAMVLDSTYASVDDFDVNRAYLRRLLWDGDDPSSQGVAAALRALVEARKVTDEQAAIVAPLVYELGGIPLLTRMLMAVNTGRRRQWERLAAMVRAELTQVRAHVMEFDLAGVINFRECYAQKPDGRPLDPALLYASVADRYPSFKGEPMDVPAALPNFTWPVAVVSGARDLRSVRPVAERIRDLTPHGVLVPFDGMAHSIMDSHPAAALAISRSVARGDLHLLPAQTGRLAALRGAGPATFAATLLNLSLSGTRKATRA
ncbi:alpha/beta hydrolase [Nonomuraea sp. NPDC046802]|uniref:alpha/beta fold hydrolase n=1 Tax=Nonomuraea sp. NPDC046802 TaxID=3154919 RepID=UPI0033C3B0DB